MKPLKRMLFILPVLMIFSTTVFADDTNIQNSDNAVENSITDSDTNIGNEENKPLLNKFEGDVSNINPDEERSMIRLKNADDAEMDFFIDSEAVIVDETGKIAIDKIKTGDNVTAYYVMPMIATLIYPPQNNAIAIVLEPVKDEKTIYVGAFNEDLTSDDNTLKLNVSDDKADEMRNKLLAVIYTVSTKSIPAQANPEEVIIIGDIPEKEALPPIEPETPEVTPEPDEVPVQPEKTPVFYLDQGEYYKHGSTDITMLPLRPIAEALGYEVGWDGATRSVTVGNVIQFKVGEDNYIYSTMEPRKLGAAPEIMNGSTYVPIHFFSEILEVEVEINNHIVTIYKTVAGIEPTDNHAENNSEITDDVNNASENESDISGDDQTSDTTHNQ